MFDEGVVFDVDGQTAIFGGLLVRSSFISGSMDDTDSMVFVVAEGESAISAMMLSSVVLILEDDEGA